MPILTSDADTIAAIATPRGEGGIGIIRVSGGDALKIVQAIFRPSVGSTYAPTRSHALTHGVIVSRDDDAAVDEVLVGYFEPPRTYTGEEMLEINAHGGLVGLETILRLLTERGARLANPGEFTQRAFLNGRLDLAQAEAVADLIHAKTEQSLRAAAAQLRGSLSKRVEAERQALIAVLAETEAMVDFPDEELDFEPSDKMLANARGSMARLDELAREADKGRLLRDGLDVVIVGKPNVGKSSLLNALLDDDRAIVTEIPGTTRDVIEEYVNLRGIPIRLTDTAGIRETVDPVEREGVSRSRQRAEVADLLLLMLDTSRPLTVEDDGLISRMRERVAIVVLNKIDLEPAWEASVLDERLRSVPRVSVSITENRGLDTLAEAIVEAALGGDSLGAEPPAVTNLRHRAALREAVEALRHVEASMASAESPELIAVDLRGALNALGLIVGETVTDDILDRIFSQFCIGK
ncbi:MAG: tRNA uridine-5-carboxymethylaminomethyl(34) synthesis GTPase MnmE [Candidatus Poribacteria bacterium]|nr:tRNA uridine-5-carboxymethylaminomethyl(34) synthesis GTPase MnmE [Candidatus Poribacteria bacterium]